MAIPTRARPNAARDPRGGKPQVDRGEASARGGAARRPARDRAAIGRRARPYVRADGLYRRGTGLHRAARRVGRLLRARHPTPNDRSGRCSRRSRISRCPGSANGSGSCCGPRSCEPDASGRGREKTPETPTEDSVMPVIQSDGCAINVQVEGPEGAPVLMLSNSLGTNLSMWDGRHPPSPSTSGWCGSTAAATASPACPRGPIPWRCSAATQLR